MLKVQSLAHPPTLELLAPAPLQLIGALRLWALASRLRWCPVGTVAQRLGSMRAAAQLRMIIAQVGAAWPDPFCVAPPCSARLSHDEATVAAMLSLAARDDRAGFDRLLADLLPFDAREHLFESLAAMARTLDA